MRVFLNYTSNKDDFGEVALFRKHLEMELKNFDPGAKVIQDLAVISPGQAYPKRLEEELIKSDVLIVHLSPAWLQSEWCRWEYETFTSDENKAQSVIPLLVVTTPSVRPDSTDNIASKLSQLEYTDIRQLRHQSWDTTEKRLYAAKLAEIVNAMVTGQGSDA